MEHGASLVQLLRTDVERLAAPACDQLAWIIENQVANDELALAFYDEYLVARSLERHGFLTPRQLTALDALDQQLDRMSGPVNAVLWTEEAIRVSPEWERVRVLARAALDVGIGAAG